MQHGRVERYFPALVKSKMTVSPQKTYTAIGNIQGPDGRQSLKPAFVNTHFLIYTNLMGWLNDKEAFVIANTYGFCPPRVAVPDHTKALDRGKYEPDHNEGAETRWMQLAQPIDHTKILILYEPDNLEP